MNKDSIETIEHEMAVLTRLITSVTANQSKANMDRAAYLLLHQLSVEGTAGVKTLATALQLDISTVSRQAAALEQKGYANKKPDPLDRRAYFYQLTESGIEALEQYKQVRLDKFSKLLDEWSDEERQNFGQLLKKFNHTVKKKI